MAVATAVEARVVVTAAVRVEVEMAEAVRGGGGKKK